MGHVIIFVVITCSHVNIKEEHTVHTLAAALHERNSRIHTISCHYTCIELHSEFTIVQRAKSDGRPVEEVGRQMSTPPIVGAFEETRSGMFRFEHTRLGPDGRPGGRRSLFFDDKESFLVTTRARIAEVDLSDVVIKQNARVLYDAEEAARRLLGDTVLAYTDQTDRQVRPLFAQIEDAKASEVLAPEAVGDSECVVVRWQNAGADPSVKAPRATAWLDKRRGLVVRRYREESRPSDEDAWVVTQEWDVEGLASSPFRSDHDGPREYWHPLIVTCKYYDLNANLVLTTRWNIHSVVLNAAIPAGRFKPEIEDGSNVIDASTGRGFVYGGGLSPRLRKLIHQQLDASRDRLRSEVDVHAADDVMAHRRRWTGAVSWTALALGSAGLLGALWMRRRA